MRTELFKMDTYALWAMGISAVTFIGVGIYMHILRKRAEQSVPAPFTNPHGKRKPKKK